jgi:aminoglycoside phosphotransferase (APT) family kinase protein
VAQLHRGDVQGLDLFSPHPVNLATFWRVWQASRGPILRWLVDREVAAMERLFRQIWARIEVLMQASLPLYGETPPAAIHGDLRAENAILSRGRAVLLDWELFGLGDPAQEIARFLFLHRHEWDEAAQEGWLQRYLAQSGEQAGLAGRIALYQRIYPFHSLTFLLHGLQRELAQDPSQAAELAESRDFLAQTIVSTLQHTAATFLGEPEDESTLFDEARRVMNEE